MVSAFLADRFVEVRHAPLFLRSSEGGYIVVGGGLTTLCSRRYE